jgi:hypothetical protein
MLFVIFVVVFDTIWPDVKFGKLGTICLSVAIPDAMLPQRLIVSCALSWLATDWSVPNPNPKENLKWDR